MSIPSRLVYSYLSNKRGIHAYRFWKIPPSKKKKKIPPPRLLISLLLYADIIAETNDDFLTIILSYKTLF